MLRPRVTKRRARLTLAVGAVLLFAAALTLSGFAAQLLEDMPGVAQLAWKTGVVQLPQSSGILTVPAHAKVVVGSEAAKLERILEGDTDTEAVLRLTHVGTVEYQFCNCGYTIADDWSCVDPAEVLPSIARYYASQRREYDVVGWGRKPRFEPASDTVTYMLRMRGPDGDEAYEANAMVFARDGFETLIAVTRQKDAASTWSTLQTALSAFRFPNGQRHRDHEQDDTASVNHIATQFANKAGADDLVDYYFAKCGTVQQK